MLLSLGIAHQIGLGFAYKVGEWLQLFGVENREGVPRKAGIGTVCEQLPADDK